MLINTHNPLLVSFVQESNRIEGIENTTADHILAHVKLLSGPLHIPALIDLVRVLQPDARFRNTVDIPGVRVGDHIAPPSGPHIEDALRRILPMRDPWEQHIAYETLHPFTDGNGRSGRALWLHRHWHDWETDSYAVARGFLHSFYYHTLSGVRLAASGIETATAAETGNTDSARKGESPAPKGDAQTPSAIPPSKRGGPPASAPEDSDGA